MNSTDKRRQAKLTAKDMNCIALALRKRAADFRACLSEDGTGLYDGPFSEQAAEAEELARRLSAFVDSDRPCTLGFDR